MCTVHTFGVESLVCDGWSKDVVDVHGENLEEALRTGRRDCIGRMVRVRPRIRPLRVAAVGELIEHTLRGKFRHRVAWESYFLTCNPAELGRQTLYG